VSTSDGGPEVVIDTLGPFELRIAGASVSVAPRLRTLLALLSESRGAFVSAEELIDQLWNAEVIETPAKTLQGFIARLRKLIGTQNIISRFGSYGLSNLVHVVSVEFERQSHTFLSAERDSNPRAIAASAQRLEAMWRGRPFDSVPATPAIDSAVRRLTNLQARLVTHRIDAQIQYDPAGVISELESLLVSDPIREECWVLLIRSLHLSNRRSDALNAATRARRILATELGLQPGAALRAAETAALTDEQTEPSVDPGVGSPKQPHPSPSKFGTFVGRQRELSAIDALIQTTSAGKTVALVVQGPAGIGKTALLAQAASAVEAQGGAVLVGRSDAHLNREYGAASDILEQVTQRCPTSDLDSELFARCERVRLSGRTSITDLTDQRPSTAPRFERRLVARAVALRLREAAKGKLLNVVFEDLHWADAGTLDVVQELIAGISSEQLLISIAHRTDDRNTSLAAVLHEGGRMGNLRRLVLSPFNLSEVTELVSALAGAENASSSVIEEIMIKTDGNALLATEMASSLHVISDLPEGVRDLVEARLAGCSRRATIFAQYASVVGREFDVRLVSVAVDALADHAESESGADTTSPVDELVKTGLVEVLDRDRAAFRHELLCDAVLARISPSQRTRLHLGILETLEADGSDDLDALVFHAAGAASAHRAATRHTQRARRSLISGHLDAAMTDATAALRWHQRDPEADTATEADLRLTIADVHELGGNFEASETALYELLRWTERVVVKHEGLVRVAALRRLARTKLKQRNPGAWDELHEAVGLIGFDAPTDAAALDEWIEMWMTVFNAEYFFPSERDPWPLGTLERIRKTIKRQGSVRQRVDLQLRQVQMAIKDSNFLPTATQANSFRTVFDMARRIGDLDLIAESSFGVGFVHLCRFEGKKAWVCFDDAAERHLQAGDAMWAAMALLYGAMARRFVGDVQQTREQIEKAAPLVHSTLAPPYQSVLDGCMLWIDLRERAPARGTDADWVSQKSDLMEQLHGRLDHPSIARAYPFNGFFLWPMLEVVARAKDKQRINQYVDLLLHSGAQPVPDDVRTMLEKVAQQPDSASLAEALKWARTHNLT
jgi:DNA-binding SARP family transcriptional activator